MAKPPPTPRAELVAWRRELARTRGGARLLDRLLSSRDALQRIRSLPVEDLYRYLVAIGLEDAHDVLALASGAQIRGLVDIDAWTGDQLDLERLDTWLAALLQAGPEALMRGMHALDDELLNWVVRRSTRVEVVEDPEAFEPPDEEHVMTPDGRLCVIFPESAPRDLPLKVFLDWTMRTDPAFGYNLLLFADAALDSNLEEGALRWRAGRMADLGYVDAYEALAVYAPPSASPAALRAAGPDEPAPPERWLQPIVEPEARLAAALEAVGEAGREPLQHALAWLCNMALAADRVPAWDEARQRAVLARVRAGLVLGLDAIAGAAADAERDAEALRSTALTDIFRHGYARMSAAAQPAREAAAAGLLRGPGGRVDGVDIEALRAWAEALTDRHPRRPDGTPLATGEAVARAGEIGALLGELGRLAGDDRPETVGVGAWLFTWMTRALLGISRDAGPLPSDRLEEAHRAWFEGGAVRAEAREAADAFFREIGGRNPRAVTVLLAAVAEELGGVAEEALEPRYVSLLWVGDA